MATLRQDLGPVTAYAFAVEKGYAGTEEEYAELMASYATVAEAAAGSASDAADSASDAEAYGAGTRGGSAVTDEDEAYHNNAKYYADQAADDASTVSSAVSTFTETTVPGAVQSVTDEGTRQVGLVQGEGTTQIGLVQAKGTEQVAAVQAKGTEVIGSIPQDYSDLSDDVSDLKSAFSELQTVNNVAVSWNQGYIKNADGTTGTDSNYCYCDYIKSTGTSYAINGHDGYKIKVARYNSSKVFQEILVSLTENTHISFNLNDGEFFRIQYGKGDSATTPSSITDDVFVLTYAAFTDTSLTLSGKAADSEAVGKKANGIDNKIDLIADGAYETIKGVFEIGSILNGVNSTSTTRIRHKTAVSYDRDIIIFVKDGFKYYVAFYDASNTFLFTREFVTKNLPITIKSGLRFRMVICKTTEETVTDIDAYINNVLIGTQLFSNSFIYKNPLVRQVAHQGYSGHPGYSTGRNLVSSYVYAGIVGFTHGECDIQFTSDNVPVCIHDASFVDATSGTTIIIADHTYSELIAYDYYGETIASFDDVVKTCKMNGMGLYIDHLDATWTNTQWDTLFEVVKKYGMAKHVVWLLPTITNLLIDPIKTFDADASFSYVLTAVPQSFSAVVSAMADLKTDSNTVSIDVPSTAFPASGIETYAELMTASVQLEVWVVDTISSYMDYLPYVNGITSNKICANIARYV